MKSISQHFQVLRYSSHTPSQLPVLKSTQEFIFQCKSRSLVQLFDEKSKPSFLARAFAELTPSICIQNMEKVSELCDLILMQYNTFTIEEFEAIKLAAIKLSSSGLSSLLGTTIQSFLLLTLRCGFCIDSLMLVAGNASHVVERPLVLQIAQFFAARMGFFAFKISYQNAEVAEDLLRLILLHWRDRNDITSTALERAVNTMRVLVSAHGVHLAVEDLAWFCNKLDAMSSECEANLRELAEFLDEIDIERLLRILPSLNESNPLARVVLARLVKFAEDRFDLSSENFQLILAIQHGFNYFNGDAMVEYLQNVLRRVENIQEYLTWHSMQLIKDLDLEDAIFQGL